MSKADKPFLIIVLILLFVGFFIFTSASLGLLAREEINFGYIALKQLGFGVVLGLLCMLLVSRVHYSFWNKYSLPIFIFSLLLTLAVFIPGLSFSHGGATRWLALGPFTFQPAEFLKIGFIIYLASWLSEFKNKIESFKYGLLPFGILLLICAAVLLIQPDTDTFVVLAISGMAMYFAAGARWRDILLIGLIGIIGLSALIYSKPYLKARLLTFANPAADPLNSGYQIQQSLIAIGSGEVFGRGFGKSLQKFNYLPEPVGDSIFAVFAEEWGLIGSVALIILFILFAMRGLKIAANAPNMFGALVTTGIIIHIISQSLINIAAMLAVVPLTGMPLVFISQGGTAMLFALAAIGIVLNVSKHQKTQN